MNAPNEDIEVLAKGGRTNIAGFFMRLIARIPFLFIAGQWYGPEILGRMAYAVLVVEFVAQLVTLGLKRGLALHMSGGAKDNGVWDALSLVCLACVAPTAGLMLFPQLMFPNSSINGLDLLIPLTIPAMALADIMLAALAYRYDVGATVRARNMIEPWTLSAVAFLMSWHNIRDGLLISYSLSIAMATLAATAYFFKSYGLPNGWRPNPSTFYQLAKRNLPLAAADGIEWGSRRVDLAILGEVVSPATVGIYYVAQQIATLPQRLKSSFDPILGPVITRKLEIGDKAAVARQLSQVGFWIIAAQAGIALALGLSSPGILGMVGKGDSFVAGTGAAAFLLLAEVVASPSVVSEAALVYVARHRNLMISFFTICLQGALSYGIMLYLHDQGWPELWQTAGPAAALALSLGISSRLKTRTIQHVLGAPVSVLRRSLFVAIAAGFAVGWFATMGPEWSKLAIGVPAILAVYSLIIWRYGFGEEDRALFRKTSA